MCFPGEYLCETAPLESRSENHCTCERPLAFGESSKFEPVCHRRCSQLISSPDHPTPPSAPVLRRLAPGIPGSRALLFILSLHHALAVSSPHGFCLFSLLSDGCKVEKWVIVFKVNDCILLKSKRCIYLHQYFVRIEVVSAHILAK